MKLNEKMRAIYRSLGISESQIEKWENSPDIEDLVSMMCAPGKCDHKLLPVVEFDEVAAKGMSSLEVRQRWPRGYNRCPSCGEYVIQYASMGHYIMGDW